MAGLDENGQWIVLMGFMVSVCILAFAILLAQASSVGQITGEEGLLFPKDQIRDVRAFVCSLPPEGLDDAAIREDIRVLALSRWNAVVDYSADLPRCNGRGYVVRSVSLFYTDGCATYEEVLDVAAGP